MTIHIGAAPGDIADTVLLPGDPYRAKWAAETFLSDIRLVNEVRGMLGFTGTWNGHRVTIQGSGMGMPSLSIYVNELIRDYDAKTLIRIGSCGGMQEHVAVRDVIIAMTATTVNTPSSTIFKELNFAPTADWSLLRAAVTASESMAPGGGSISAYVGSLGISLATMGLAAVNAHSVLESILPLTSTITAYRLVLNVLLSFSTYRLNILEAQADPLYLFPHKEVQCKMPLLFLSLGERWPG